MITPEQICPHLGLVDDPKTRMQFPNSCQACHRADPPQPVVLTHQRTFCLAQAHTECEGFSTGWPEGFPRQLRNKHCPRSRGRRPATVVRRLAVAVLLVVLLVGALLGVANLPLETWFGGRMGTPTPKLAATQTRQALAAILTSTATPSLTHTSTPTPVPTSTPTVFLTPTDTPGPALKTPFGQPGVQLLIHEVQTQESLTVIANQYNTTIDVLWLMNGLANRDIAVGDVIVVCLDCAVMPDLPPLQPMFVEPGTLISDLAAEYAVSINDLHTWNGLGGEAAITGERWIVVTLEIQAND